MISVPPARMHRIREALALRLDTPDVDRGQTSRMLYLKIRHFDELFFRLWRLSGRHPSAKPRVELKQTAEQAWAYVQTTARGFTQRLTQ